MKLGIIGLPQTGKRTLFRLLTGKKTEEISLKPVPGVADILDSRFDTLVDMYKPEKNTRARINLVLFPEMKKEAIARGEIFEHIADTDAVCHLVRAFEDDSVYHEAGSIDPLRDVEMVNSELIMHDQIFAEKRIERIKALSMKKKDENQIRELVLMNSIREHLEDEKPLRLLRLSDDEEKMIRSYPFITGKKMVIALNVSEYALGNEDLLSDFREICRKEMSEVIFATPGPRVSFKPGFILKPYVTSESLYKASSSTKKRFLFSSSRGAGSFSANPCL